MKKSLEEQFKQARKDFPDALTAARETGHLVEVYQSAFDNPYADDQADVQHTLAEAVRAFGPLMGLAISAGHHGRWISRRLPSVFTLVKTEEHTYAARMFGALGCCCSVDTADSGISDREHYVQWPV